MRREHLIAALGSVTLHGACVVGLVFWRLDPVVFSGPMGGEIFATVGSPPAQSTGEPMVGSSSQVDSSNEELRRAEGQASSSSSDTSSRQTAGRVATKLPKKSDISSATKTAPVVDGSYSWPEGEKRRKVSGTLPRPANLGPLPDKVSINLTVSPNGTVHALKVIDPTGTGFEREAVRLLRRWRFEVLPRSLPQRESHCIVTLRIKH